MLWFQKRLPLWSGDGLYATRVVGTSYYRDAIASVAKNSLGSPALVFCVASLRCCHHVEDPHAVEVHIAGQQVGHLSRELAPRLREALQRNGQTDGESYVRAVVTNGLSVAGRFYEYTVELDLEVEPEKWKLAWERVQPDEVDRRAAYPLLLPCLGGAREGRVWLPVASLDELHRERRVDGWTREGWTSVNFYAENRQGVGLGFKVLEVPKMQLQEWFGTTSVQAELRQLTGRWATIVLMKG